MHYTNSADWTDAALAQGFTIVTVQGRNRFVALDEGKEVGVWSETSGHLPDPVHPLRRSTDVPVLNQEIDDHG